MTRTGRGEGMREATGAGDVLFLDPGADYFENSWSVYLII